MKTVSMKLTAADKSADRGSMVAPVSDSEAPDYPYGLRLRLSERELEKLGIGLPEVGACLSVVGTACVVEVYASADGGTKRSGFEMVMTDLGIAPEAKQGKDAASTLYPEMGED